ncbi:MAG: hypothetical protein IPM55_08125 [Acidobacteria bacterium]|nr:hypothetical protein [Acidobacteriota bacterium]
MSIRLTAEQESIASAPVTEKIYLSGMAGTGKTTTGVRRLRRLIESGVPAHSIMVLVPQKRLALPYATEIRNPRRKAGAEVTIATLGSLSHNLVGLFWPLIVRDLSRENPYRRLTFLSLEMVQYLMFKLLEPVIERNDYFNSVNINRARLFSQIADNLNKSAIVGFPHTDISARLKSALPGSQESLHIFDDAQACANIFRDYCVDNNLLDFSLQLEIFRKLWAHGVPRAYLSSRYKHLIADNLEEDTPNTHMLIGDLLSSAESALLISDEEAGYRRFLGADETSAAALEKLCDRSCRLIETRVMSRSVQAFLAELQETMTGSENIGNARQTGRARRAIELTAGPKSRFHTQMLDWVAETVESLINEKGAKQGSIVILAPLLHDSLRFSLVTRLEQKKIATYTLRPSRPLHAEPATRALVTIAKLAHPQWKIGARRQINSFDIVQMLTCAIAEMDLARATLLADVLFRKSELHPFNTITNAEMRARISEVFGERYGRIFEWIEKYKSSPAETIDVFLSRLFGEVLSQSGFGFHRDYDAARIVSNLIDSSRTFRQAASQIGDEIDIGNEYVRMVDAGILADQYEPRQWRKRPDAVLIAPAYTFLLSNQAVDYQFWLNIDSPAWSRRLYQPLTQPYVLSRQWVDGDIWSDEHERQTSREVLYRVVTGLVKRCRKKIHIGYSRFDERGNERAGDLRTMFDYLLRSLPPTTEGEEVEAADE